MPVKLTTPLEKDFVLERTDISYPSDGDPTKITVRQATQAQNERRSLIHSEVTQIINSQSALRDELQLRQQWSIEELKRVEVFLTLIGCNIIDESGNDLFKFKTESGKSQLSMSENEFKKAWGILPPDIAQEIHEKVLEVNKTWAGPLGS